MIMRTEKITATMARHTVESEVAFRASTHSASLVDSLLDWYNPHIEKMAWQQNRANAKMTQLESFTRMVTKSCSETLLSALDEQESSQAERHYDDSEVIQLQRIQKKPTLCFVHCFSLRAGYRLEIWNALLIYEQRWR